MVHWCDITIELFYFDYKSNITFLEWKGEFIECLLWMALFYCFPARQNRYIFIPLLFLCGCIGRCMLCRSLSNLLFEPLDNRLSGWWQEPISSRSSVLSPLETLSFRSWISAYVPPNRVLLHTPTAFPWRTLRSAFHRIPQGSKGFRYGAFHGNRETTPSPLRLPFFNYA